MFPFEISKPYILANNTLGDYRNKDRVQAINLFVIELINDFDKNNVAVNSTSIAGTETS